MTGSSCIQVIHLIEQLQYKIVGNTIIIYLHIQVLFSMLQLDTLCVYSEYT